MCVQEKDLDTFAAGQRVEFEVEMEIDMMGSQKRSAVKVRLVS
jgi:cold shock CspA family protein